MTSEKKILKAMRADLYKGFSTEELAALVDMKEEDAYRMLKKDFTNCLEEKFANQWQIKNMDAVDKRIAEIERFESVTTNVRVGELRMQALALKSNSPSEMFHAFVKQFLKYNSAYYDTPTKIWWKWNHASKKWEMCEDVDILRVFEQDYNIVEWIDARIREKIITVLKVIASSKPKDVPPQWICFKDKMVNIYTGQEQEPTPEWFVTSPIAYNIGESEDTPVMDALFKDWVGDNYEILYELAAYSLYRDYPLNRIFFLLGTGRNGKGSYLRMLRRFLGADNCTASKVEALNTSRFETARLKDKLLCEISELDVGEFAKTSILKRLCGKDSICYEIKNKTPSTFENYAKIAVLANTLPTTRDTSPAWYIRTIIIDFPKQFLDSFKDVIAEIPEVEYENLGRKSIRMLQRLLEKNKFTGEESFEKKRDIYEGKSNLLKTFIEQNYEFDTDGFVWKHEFMELFKDFCKRKNVQAWSDTMVNEKLKKDFALEIKGKNFYNEEGIAKNWKAIIGIKRKEEKIPSGSSDPSGNLQSFIHMENR